MDTDTGANIYDDVPMTEKKFHELFGYSDSESDMVLKLLFNSLN